MATSSTAKVISNLSPLSTRYFTATTVSSLGITTLYTIPNPPLPKISLSLKALDPTNIAPYFVLLHLYTLRVVKLPVNLLLHATSRLQKLTHPESKNLCKDFLRICPPQLRCRVPPTSTPFS
nr:hypothetical protein Iba_chr03bCG8660 [Ipomoea batatas]